MLASTVKQRRAEDERVAEAFAVAFEAATLSAAREHEKKVFSFLGASV